MKYIPKYQRPFSPLVTIQDNTRTVYPQQALIQLQQGLRDNQKEQDYQTAIKTKSEVAFKEKYKQSPHRYKYDTDPQYKAQTDKQGKVSAKENGAIDLPSSDLRRKDVVNPANMWMYPNLTGESNRQATNFSNEVIGAALPILLINKVGKLPGITDKVINSTLAAGKNLVNPAERLLTEQELLKLNQTLDKKGILPQQKTFNWPWKEPIRKAIEPFGYGSAQGGMTITGGKFSDLKGAIFGGKNPSYVSSKEWLKILSGYDDDIAVAFKNLRQKKLSGTEYEDAINNLIESTGQRRSSVISEPNIKKALNNRDKLRIRPIDPLAPKEFSNTSPIKLNNRYTTWDMYLGKPQIKHPMYTVSPLSTNKKTVYTIKPEFTNKAAIERELKENINLVANKDSNLGRWNILTDNRTKDYTLLDSDASYFGTMGGFNWKFKPLENGNVQAIANDIWDLNPYQQFKIKQKWVPQVIKNKIEPLVQKIEVGKLLGIGKPLDVRVGFEFDKTGNIIKQFKCGGNMKYQIKSKTKKQKLQDGAQVQYNDAIKNKRLIKKGQTGLKVISGPTVYSRNDPAYKAYQDSLSEYNYGVKFQQDNPDFDRYSINEYLNNPYIPSIIKNNFIRNKNKPIGVMADPKFSHVGAIYKKPTNPITLAQVPKLQPKLNQSSNTNLLQPRQTPELSYPIDKKLLSSRGVYINAGNNDANHQGEGMYTINTYDDGSSDKIKSIKRKSSDLIVKKQIGGKLPDITNILAQWKK